MLASSEYCEVKLIADFARATSAQRKAGVTGATGAFDDPGI